MDYVIKGFLKISIHASRVGGDKGKVSQGVAQALFQSTPPGWEATRASNA